ncbi:hypothetical protein BHE74_00054562 [Ensete ventricosum]|nr:hypothetical protein GW17_00043928 [Ensete ventricosum]RWW40058.1 hypothetical protein BHE74_00054562 [Ensete ventricosum]RZS25915.1 hypothetical protein BHM03_00059190 [Ensete ventricosum]
MGKKSLKSWSFSSSSSTASSSSIPCSYPPLLHPDHSAATPSPKRKKCLQLLSFAAGSSVLIVCVGPDGGRVGEILGGDAPLVPVLPLDQLYAPLAAHRLPFPASKELDEWLAMSSHMNLIVKQFSSLDHKDFS